MSIRSASPLAGREVQPEQLVDGKRSRLLDHWNSSVTSSLPLKHDREDGGLAFTFACLISLRHLGLFSLHAIMAKGWHSPTGSPTQQVRSPLDVLVRGHGQPRFTACCTAPLGTMVSYGQYRTRVYSCQTWLEREKEQEKVDDRASTYNLSQWFGRKTCNLSADWNNHDQAENKQTLWKNILPTPKKTDNPCV